VEGNRGRLQGHGTPSPVVISSRPITTENSEEPWNSSQGADYRLLSTLDRKFGDVLSSRGDIPGREAFGVRWVRGEGTHRFGFGLPPAGQSGVSPVPRQPPHSKRFAARNAVRPNVTVFKATHT
jgi:hypothetical protein